MMQNELRMESDVRVARRIAASFVERQVLFWNSSLKHEQRDLLLARIGFVASMILLTLVGLVEAAFFGVILWLLIR